VAASGGAVTAPSRSTCDARPSGISTSSDPSASLSTIMQPIVHRRRRAVDRPDGLGRAVERTAAAPAVVTPFAAPSTGAGQALDKMAEG